jgi:hypothetical protein
MSVANETAAEAGRLLARARWGTRGVDKAIETIRARRDELGEAQRAQLAELAVAGRGDGGDDAA